MQHYVVMGKRNGKSVVGIPVFSSLLFFFKFPTLSKTYNIIVDKCYLLGIANALTSL